jgi:kynurenine 3-monooxygenase
MHIIISGAGLAGSLMAIYLAKKGHKVDIYESRLDMRKATISAGRSINLALSSRGLKALHEVGLEQEILKGSVKMPGRMMHDKESKTIFALYGKNEDEYINSISRADLNKILMTAAEKYPEVSIYFRKEIRTVDFDKKTLEVYDLDNGGTEKLSADLIIGADGANSIIRRSMEKQIPDYQSRIDWLDHGYKELSIPPADGGGFRLERDALHIWPRSSYMLIALPNADGSFTCTLFYPNEGAESFAAMDNYDKFKKFMETEFPDAVPHMIDMEEEYHSNPVGKLGTLKCYPWKLGNAAVLIGDAAHAIVPFYGQGMNASFEDCYTLNECIDRYGDNWTKILEEYEAMRKINGDAIGDLAVENFYEMRDKVADPVFQRKRKLEHIIENRFANYRSKYALVTFSPDVPYTYAKSQGNKQDNYLMNLCRDIETVESLDIEQIYAELIKL